MKDVTRTKIEIGETAATITCDEKFVGAAVNGITKARAEIKSYARNNEEFLLSLEPVAPDKEAPMTVRRMCEASEKSGVGPMAAVAGAIALAGVEAAMAAGATHCIIDNGGDIALVLDRPITVGILEDFNSGLMPAVELEPTNGRIIGLCTSSGVFGHSISFGKAQAATVMASNPPLADAAATALGNGCKSAEHIKEALESISAIEGVIWAMAIVDGKVGTLGRLPKLTIGKAARDSITVHSDFPAAVPLK